MDAIAGAVISSLGGLVGYAGLWQRGKIEKLAALPRESPASLASFAGDGADPAPSTSTPTHPPPRPRLVALTGVAAAPGGEEGGLVCELDTTGSVRAVITTLREEALSLAHLPSGRWVREAHTLRSTSREAAGWGVGEATSGGDAKGTVAAPSPSIIIPVLAATAAHSLPLSPVGDTITTPPSSPAPLTLLDSLLGRRPLGTRRVEAALVAGTPLTVVGEVVEMEEAGGGEGKPRRRVLAIRPPPHNSGVPFLATSRPFEAVVEEARAAATAAVRVGAFTVGLGLFVALAGRGWRAWRRRTVARRAAAARARIAAARAARAARAAAACGDGETLPPPPPEGEDDDPSAASTCVVCLDAPADWVWTACGHLCACGECAARTGAKCPVCRARGRALKVFRT